MILNDAVSMNTILKRVTRKKCYSMMYTYNIHYISRFAAVHKEGEAK